jgi:hypothetical protein
VVEVAAQDGQRIGVEDRQQLVIGEPEAILQQRGGGGGQKVLRTGWLGGAACTTANLALIAEYPAQLRQRPAPIDITTRRAVREPSIYTSRGTQTGASG